MNRSLLPLAVVLAIGCGTEKPATVNHDAAKQTSTERIFAEVERLDGSIFDPLVQPAAVKARVFVFLTTDCPIANRYAPTLQRIAKQCKQHNIAFTLVYPNEADTASEIQEHLKQYQHGAVAVRDPKLKLVALTGVTVTPEAAVFDGQGEMTYRGRIDDWYADFGKYRRKPTTHDLRNAIRAVATGTRVASRTTKAVGCYIHEKAGSAGSAGR